MFHALTSRAGSLMLALAFAAGCGDGENNVDVVVSTIDFGQTNCGETPTPRILTITNNTPNAFNFTTTLSGGADSRYEIIPPIGSVLPRQQVSVMVHSKPIPQTSALTENLYGETITVTTQNSDRETVHEVAITHSARGAVFEASSTAINFAAPQGIGTVGQQPVTITNVGNAPATLDAQSSFRSFRLAGTGKVLAPGEAFQTNVEFLPAHNSFDTQTLTLSAGDAPVCGGSGSIVVTGTGTAQGLAAHAVPAPARGRADRGVATLCVRLTNGAVACGGRNTFGMLGVTDDFLATVAPLPGKGGKGGGGGIGLADLVVAVQTKSGYLDEVVELVSGTGFYCARRQAGDVWCWGDYLGLGERADTSQRTHYNAELLGSLGTTTSIAAGYNYRCIVRTQNNALSCRTQRVATSSYVSPTLWTANNVVQAVTSGPHGYARLADGTVLSFGVNNSGERGNEDGPEDPPSAVTGLTDVTHVTAGGRAMSSSRFGCARKSDSTVWCWGSNNNGQLGDGALQGGDSIVPSQVVELVDVENTAIAATTVNAGFAHACAIVGSGAVKCWGRGTEGQVGPASSSSFISHAQTVTGITGATTIESAGTNANFATFADGKLRMWGQFGGTNYHTPQPVYAFEP